MRRIESAEMFEARVGDLVFTLHAAGVLIQDGYRNNVVYINAHDAQDLATEILLRYGSPVEAETVGA